MEEGPLRISLSRESGAGALMEGVGAGLAFIGAYVPWVVTFALFATVPVRGVDTPYARILSVVPLIAFGLLAWRWYALRARWVHVPIIILGLSTMVLTAVYALDVHRNAARAQQSIARSAQTFPGMVRVQFDIGIYLSAAGGAAMVIGGLIGLREDRLRQRREEPEGGHFGS